MAPILSESEVIVQNPDVGVIREGECDGSGPTVIDKEGSGGLFGGDQRVSIDRIDPILLGPLPVDK